MDISTRTILRVLLVTSGFVGVLWIAYLARTELVWLGTAFFLAVALNPLVEWLTKHTPKHNRLLSIAMVSLLLLLVLAFIVISFVPPLVQQSTQLSRNLPAYTDQLVHGHSFVSDQIRHYNLVDRIRESQDQLLKYASTAGSQFFTIVRGVFASFLAAITILGLTFFMLLEGPGWVAAFWSAVPARQREHGQYLANQMYRAVTGYVTGNLLTSLIAALGVTIVLAILHVPYAIPLGIFVGIMDLLPLVGATLGAVVVVLVALLTSPFAALVMLVFFLIYQQVENHILQPIIYGRTVEISPLLVLISVLIGAAAGGIVGAIVAVPVFASLQIVVKDYANGRAKAAKH